LIKGTKKRWIEAPSPALKRIQRRLLSKLLYQLQATDFAHGFVPGRSIVSNAQCHVGRDWLVTLDLKDFFPSVTAAMIEPELASLIPRRSQREQLVQLVTRRGHLPQGAPTSPHLANLVARRLDQRLVELSERLGWTYTRYADDLSFSGDTDPGELLPRVEAIVLDEQFRLARQKTRVRSRHQRQVVTGLVVNDRVRLPKPQRRRLRAMLHRARYDPDLCWDKMATQVMAGHLAFAAFVDPAGHQQSCLQLRQLVQSHGQSQLEEI
jgi:retron-type reverse transcriptase